jgi:hypothetical protein
VSGIGVWALTISPIQSPEAIHLITPQPQESGYRTKVLTNTFGLANRKRRLFLRGRPGLLRLHQPKVCLYARLPALAYANASVNTIVQ